MPTKMQMMKNARVSTIFGRYVELMPQRTRSPSNMIRNQSHFGILLWFRMTNGAKFENATWISFGGFASLSKSLFNITNIPETIFIKWKIPKNTTNRNNISLLVLCNFCFDMNSNRLIRVASFRSALFINISIELGARRFDSWHL